MTIMNICPECGGEGRRWRSKYGGNDPDVWDAGPCEHCDGAGYIPVLCDDCRTPAVERIDGHPYCTTHADEIREEAKL